MFHPLPPPRRRLRGGGRRENGAQITSGHRIFMKNPPGAALLPESARNHMVATAAQRLPARVRPQGAPTYIDVSYALMMHIRSSASMYLARGTKRPAITPSPTRFGNRLKPANRTHRPYHTRARIIGLMPVTAHVLGPRNCGVLRRNPHSQTLTIARLNRITTWTIQPATAYMKLSAARRSRLRLQAKQ